MKNKTKILLTTLVILVAFLVLGTTNVNAATVTVMNETQLKEAVSGSDSSITEVKLGANITLTEYLEIIPITDLTLDLSGFTIDGETNSKSVGIAYGSNGLTGGRVTSGSLTIKDSSSDNTGKIISYKTIVISNNNLDTTSTKNFKLTIEGGNFSTLYVSDATVFTLSSSDRYMKDKNITFDFQIKDGYFYARGSQAIFFYAGSINANNVTLNVNYDKLTFKGSNSRLVYSDKTFTVNDVVSADSNIKLKNSIRNTEGTLTDRTLSATAYNAFSGVLLDYDTIEITKTEGFDVTNVTLNENFGYTSPTSKTIVIKNRGTNSLQVKSVTVDSENFEIVGTAQPTVTAGSLDNTSFKIKPKTGLNAGTYTGVITVKDMANKTYTADVTLTVARKPLGEISISQAGWTYGDTTIPGYTKSGLDSVLDTQYKVEYSKKNANSWSTTKPKTAGTYTIRLTITDKNLEAKSAESDFVIAKNNKEIQIIANSGTWTYDGNSHSNTGYTVKYNGAVVTGGVLPTGDTISAIISGSVKDVKDTVTGNNVIDSYTIQNRDSYSNITTTKGTLTIKKVETPIIVTAASKSKAYDGSALTKNTFTYTTGVLKAGEILTATVSGTQTYVGTSDNTVSNVKVMRGNKDITSNYTFGTHVNGRLRVTAVNQPLSIAAQYVTVGGTLLTSELEAALSGAKGNVSFAIKTAGAGGVYDEELYGGFEAGNAVADVIMVVTAQAFDVNGDGTAEYNLTKKEDLVIHVVTKETVTISGITNNQEFIYDGNTKTPAGTITVTGNKVPVSALEVSYTGTGSTTYSSTTAPKNVGTYSVTYKVPNSNANYVGSATFNFTIKKAKLLKVTLISTSYEYTGEKISVPVPNNWINGTVMSSAGDFEKTDVGNYTIIVALEDKDNYEWSDGSTSDLTLNWSITKADPDYEKPTNLTGIKGQTLNEITLPSGFTWNTPSTPLTVGTHTYKAKYTPSDTKNYNVVNNIDITVVTKDIFNVTTLVVSGNGTISTSYSNVVEGSEKEITFTPATGFMIDKVLVNDVETSVTGNKLALTVNEDKVVKVSYKKIPFTITVVSTEGVTITPNGVVAVNYGEMREFIITANSGYRLVKVLVNNVDKTEEMVSNKLTLNDIKSNMEVKAVVEEIVYEVIEGANQEYTITKDNEAKFRIDAEYSAFENGGKVYVDGELVNEENYTAKSGSTIIVLKQAYADTLTVGQHTLKVVFNDGGEATTNFTIKKVAEQPTPGNKPTVDVDNNTNTENKEENKGSNPTTFDNIMIYVAIAIMSMVGLGATVVVKKKQAK